MHIEVNGTGIALDAPEVIVAGWTGRDAAAVQHHIDELAALGVAPPSEVPLFYRVSRMLLSQGPQIEVLGDTSSGEVEPVLLHHDGVTYLGLGSDQTDRELEAVSVAASKQACPKPVSSQFWPLEEASAHLDQLELRCEIEENGAWVLYQNGALAALRPLPDLAARVGLSEGQLMFCGTLGAIGGVRAASSYRMRLSDPILGRAIELAYRVRTLPVIA